jgi:hypothetical protein
LSNDEVHVLSIFDGKSSVAQIVFRSGDMLSQDLFTLEVGLDKHGVIENILDIDVSNACASVSSAGSSEAENAKGWGRGA